MGFAIVVVVEVNEGPVVKTAPVIWLRPPSVDTGANMTESVGFWPS